MYIVLFYVHFIPLKWIIEYCFWLIVFCYLLYSPPFPIFFIAHKSLNKYMFAASNKVGNPRQPPPETSNMFIEVLQRRPEIMQQLLATVSLYTSHCLAWVSFKEN